MAMQWCGAVARRITMSAVRAPTFSGGLPILCGRGDKRTKKGKRFKGSYGNARPKKDKKIERIKDRVEVPSWKKPASKQLIFVLGWFWFREFSVFTTIIKTIL